MGTYKDGYVAYDYTTVQLDCLETRLVILCKATSQCPRLDRIIRPFASDQGYGGL